MRKKSLIAALLIPALVIGLSSCSMGTKSPENVVKVYLDEMMIIKDPMYKKAARDDAAGDPKKAKRYEEANRKVEDLMWTDPASIRPERRKKLLMTLGAIVTYKSYRITSQKIESDKALVTVEFQPPVKTAKDKGKSWSGPTTYELAKTKEGWLLKDVNGLLSKAGM